MSWVVELSSSASIGGMICGSTLFLLLLFLPLFLLLLAIHYDDGLGSVIEPCVGTIRGYYWEHEYTALECLYIRNMAVRAVVEQPLRPKKGETRSG